MKILQLCHKMPCPLQDGGAYSIYHTALGLIFQNAQVKVLAINTPKSKVDPNCIPLDFRMKTSFESLPADTRFKPFNAMVNLFTCQSYFVERFYSDEFNAGLIQILLREEFDIVQLEHIYMCLYLGTIRKRSTAKVILRPQNVENQVWQRCQGYVTNPVKRTYMRMATTRLLMYEMDMANDVDGIMAISAADAGTFRAYAPEIPVVAVPIGFDFSKLSAYDANKQFERFPVFYHLGSMDWLPNVQGVKWFIQEVIPYVRDVYPEFVFRIAGKKWRHGFISGKAVI